MAARSRQSMVDPSTPESRTSSERSSPSTAELQAEIAQLRRENAKSQREVLAAIGARTQPDEEYTQMQVHDHVPKQGLMIRKIYYHAHKDRGLLPHF